MIRDNWLSEKLGKPAYHLVLPDDLSESFNEHDEACFIDAKIPVGYLNESRKIAESLYLIETAITLDCSRNKLIEFDARIIVREPIASEAKIIIDIARRNFTNDRFHQDPNIPNVVADQLKADWVENFFLGLRGTRMYVAEIDSRVSGFLLILDEENTSTIDLIAVDKPARRKGLAAAMIQGAANSDISRSRFRVGTQLSNLDSVQFYESLGFRTTAAHHVFHGHVN